MLGRSHVAITAGTWAVAAPAVATAPGTPLGAAELAISTALAAGAAQLPDWDAPGSNLAHALGPLGRLLAWTIGRISGGHRRGTHTLVAAALVTAVAWTAGRAGERAVPIAVPGVDAGGGVTVLPAGWPALAVALLLLYTLATTLGLAIRRERPLADAVYLVQAVGVLALARWAVPGPWWWLPAAIGAGYLAHLLQDLLTPAGLPWLFWPVSRSAPRLPLVLPTGGVVERLLAATGGLLAVGVVGGALLGEILPGLGR